MKLYDRIRLIADKKEYAAIGVGVGSIGAIVAPEIRYGGFEVEFFDVSKSGCELIPVKIEDMEVIEPSQVDDDDILAELPGNDPEWWCKVEDGYIVNLKGERKNKIPYDYNS